MKATLKTIAAVALFAFSAPAFAGGVVVAENGNSKLKLGGKVFSDITSHKVTTGATTTKTVGARIERAYFTGKYYFNDDWMMRITTDVSLQSNLNSKKNNIFLKYAYLEGKLAGKAAVLRIGQSHTPWVDYEQGLWKHRYFSKILIDTKGYDASSDLGIGLKGKVADGMAKYWVTLTNGAGYSHPGRVGKSMDIDARFGVYPVKGLTLDVQYRNGYKGTKTDPINANGNETKSTLYQVMATYGMGHDFRIGANYAVNKADDHVLVTSIKDKAYALWAWGNFGNGFGAFGRYEHSKNDAVSVVKVDRFAGGVEYSPAKHVTLALAFDNSKTKTAGLTTKKDTRYGLYTQTKF